MNDGGVCRTAPATPGLLNTMQSDLVFLLVSGGVFRYLGIYFDFILSLARQLGTFFSP